MAASSFINDFTEGKVFGKLVRFAMPLFLSNLLQVVYNMMDMVIVGFKLGKPGLSAVSIGGDVSGFLTFLAMGFSNAGQVIISQYVGAKRRDKIARFVGTMFTFLTSAAVVISAVCLILRTPILRAMNTPGSAFDEALSYSSISMAGLVFIYGYNISSAVLRGMGDSARPFVFISIAAVLNVLLDLLFVLGIGMGSGGAALATVISQGLSFVLCAAFIIKNRKRYELEISARAFFKIDGDMLKSLVKLGVPMAIKNASIKFSKLFVNSFLNSFGLAVSAFAGIANKINSMSNLVSNAFNTAGSSMVGQNIAAGKNDRVKKIMGSIFAITVVAATAFTIAFALFPRQIYGFFTKDEDVIAIGLAYLPVAVLIFYGSAARSGMNSLINGSGNTAVNFATALLDGIILRIGLAALFGLALGMGAMGFWLGDALAGFTPFFIGIVFYFSGKWKKKSAV